MQTIPRLPAARVWIIRRRFNGQPDKLNRAAFEEKNVMTRSHVALAFWGDGMPAALKSSSNSHPLSSLKVTAQRQQPGAENQKRQVHLTSADPVEEVELGLAAESMTSLFCLVKGPTRAAATDYGSNLGRTMNFAVLSDSSRCLTPCLSGMVQFI